MFGMNDSSMMGPVSLEQQSSDLKKNQMLAQMLAKTGQGAAQASAPNATAGGLNIASSLVSGLAAGYMADKNSQVEGALDKNKRMAFAQMLSGGAQ